MGTLFFTSPPDYDNWVTNARFKRRATAVPNSIDQIKFDFSAALIKTKSCYCRVARQASFKRRGTALPNSIHKL